MGQGASTSSSCFRGSHPRGSAPPVHQVRYFASPGIKAALIHLLSRSPSCPSPDEWTFPSHVQQLGPAEASRDETRACTPVISPHTNSGRLPTLPEGRCVILCRLRWQAATKGEASADRANANVIYLILPENVGCSSAASHAHGGAARHPLAKPARIMGISLRVVAASAPPETHGGAREGAKAPTLRSAFPRQSRSDGDLADRRTSPAAAAVAAVPDKVPPQITIPPPQPSAASTADPVMLSACCHHLRALFIQVSELFIPVS